VSRSTNDGRSFKVVGKVGGQPAALASRGDDFYVALHTNAVMISSDGGRTWRERVAATS
jgi:hypothetical protein